VSLSVIIMMVFSFVNDSECSANCGWYKLQEGRNIQEVKILRNGKVLTASAESRAACEKDTYL